MEENLFKYEMKYITYKKKLNHENNGNTTKVWYYEEITINQ